MSNLPILAKKPLQSGQALLLVLLSMAAILTVTLSVASRSITDISITSTEENAMRAFSAAEAGIEEALLTGSGSNSPVSVDSNVTFTSKIYQPTEGGEFVNPAVLRSGESATFWFVGRDDAGNFSCNGVNCLAKPQIANLCWGIHDTYTANDTPAVQLTVYYDWNSGGNRVGNLVSSGGTDFTHLKVARAGFDPNSGRRGSNNFTGTAGGNCRLSETDFNYHATDVGFNSDLGIPGQCASTAGCLVMAKVKVFYNDAAKPEQVGMAFTGSLATGLPAQGNIIESTGIAGESTRRVNVFQSFPEPIGIFDASVFSESDFGK